MHTKCSVLMVLFFVFLCITANGQLSQNDPKLSVSCTNFAPISYWEIPTNPTTGESIVFVRGWTFFPNQKGEQTEIQSVTIANKVVTFAEAFPVSMVISGEKIARYEAWVSEIQQPGVGEFANPTSSIIRITSFFNMNTDGDVGNNYMHILVIAYTKPFKQS